VIGVRSEAVPDLVREKVRGYALPIVAAGVVIALLYWARVVFITVAIAIIIALILEPFVALLLRARLPRSIAAFVVCVFAVLVISLAGFGGWNQLAGLATDAPAFREHLADFTGSVTDRLQNFEESVTRLVTPVRKTVTPAMPMPIPPPLPPQRKNRKNALQQIVPALPAAIPEVRIHDDRNPIADYIYGKLGTLYEVLLMASFVPFLVYFMLSWRDHMYRSFLRLFTEPDRTAATRSLEGVAAMARAFVAGNFMIGVLLSLVSWAAFALLHLPYPSLVGALSGFLTLLPYLGLAVALVPPLLAGLAAGVPSSLLFLAALIVLILHLIAMNVLYPKLVGSRVHLNPLVVTISLMFWGFLWDAPGLLLAIPITAGIKAVCDNVEDLRPYGRFLGD
jgi:predicted PurR-regulated permease PerM